MKPDEIQQIIESLNNIAELTGTDAEDLVEALTGIAWSEEEAGELIEQL